MSAFIVFGLALGSAPALAEETGVPSRYQEAQIIKEAAATLGEDQRYDAAISLYELLLRKYPDAFDSDAYERIDRVAPRKIEALKCARDKGGETVFESPKSFYKAIHEAVRDKRKDRLERYYSCGFGVCSDKRQICWLVDPSTAAAIMTEPADTVDWSKPDLSEEAVRISGREAGTGYKFEFKKIRSGWKWALLTFEDWKEPLAMEKRFYDAYIIRSTSTKISEK